MGDGPQRAGLPGGSGHGRHARLPAVDVIAIAVEILYSNTRILFSNMGWSACVESDRTVRLGPLPEEQWDDRTRDALAALQLMDLVFTVGAYVLLAMAFNTFGVEPEHER
jgi:hypothetical protein